MASPVDAARTATNVATAATSHNINVGSPAAGNLLIVFVRFAAAPGTVTFTGYTQLATDATDASDDENYVFYRWADGAEGATDTLTTVNLVKLAAICWRITGAENPATLAPLISTVVVGAAANVDPGVTPVIALIDYRAATSGGGLTVGNAASSTARAQSFVAQAGMGGVAVMARRANTPTDNLVYEIQTDSGGAPSGTVVGSPLTLLGSSLSLSVWLEYHLAVSSSLFTTAATYWIVARRSGAIDASNSYTIEMTSTDVYSGGSLMTHNGTAWVAGTARDWRFAVLAEKDFLFLTVIGLDHETATATQPAGYTNLTSANSGTAGAVATNCQIWGASKQATGVKDDPGAWTSTAPTTGVTAWTIAVAAPYTTPPPPDKPRRYRTNQVAVMRGSLR